MRENGVGGRREGEEREGMTGYLFFSYFLSWERNEHEGELSKRGKLLEKREREREKERKRETNFFPKRSSQKHSLQPFSKLKGEKRKKGEGKGERKINLSKIF